jgi:hypothetical protein
MTRTRDLWTPPGRSSRQLRNARAKLIGSVTILVLVIVVALLAALG